MTEAEFFNSKHDCRRCKKRNWRVFRLPWMRRDCEREIICRECGFREDVWMPEWKQVAA